MASDDGVQRLARMIIGGLIDPRLGTAIRLKLNSDESGRNIGQCQSSSGIGGAAATTAIPENGSVLSGLQPLVIVITMLDDCLLRRQLYYIARQCRQCCRLTLGPLKQMLPSFDDKSPWCREGDVAVFECDAGLAALEHDLVLGEDLDVIGGGGDGERLIGEDLERGGVGFEADGAVLSDGAKSAGGGVEAGAIAADAGESSTGGEVQIVLRRAVQASACVSVEALAAGQRHGIWAFEDDDGLGETFDDAAV